MNTLSRPLRGAAAAAVVLALGSGALAGGPASAEPSPPPGPDRAVAGSLLVERDGATGATLLPRDGVEVPLPEGLDDGASAGEAAEAYLDAVADVLGVDPAGLAGRGTAPLAGGGTVTRFQQRVDGLPVLGGQVVVALGDDGRLDAVVGETSRADRLPAPQVGAGPAVRRALRAAAARLGVRAAALSPLGEPRALAHDPAITGLGSGSPHVVWRVVVVPAAGPRATGGVVVLVDARDGSVLSVTPRERHALSRAVCDRANTRAVDYFAKDDYCSGEADQIPYARVEGQPPTGTAQVDLAYEQLGAVHGFAKEVLGVDLVSGEGFPRGDGIAWDAGDGSRLRVTVRYCESKADRDVRRSPCPWFNASWLDDGDHVPGVDPYPGGEMFLGDGFAEALDVVAHEMVHGMVAATAGLAYEYESGAINESMADVLGELAEQWTAGPDPRWVVGEEVSGTPSGLRDMRDPATHVCDIHGEKEDCRQPDSLLSPLWYDGDGDGGGVHVNSGVGNKAAYLMARGGVFRRVRVEPIAPTAQAAVVKTARLHWRALQMLTPYSDYADLGARLSLACAQLAGTGAGAERFTPADCARSVDPAVRATGMRAVGVYFDELSERLDELRITRGLGLRDGRLVHGQRTVARALVQELRTGDPVRGARVELQHRRRGGSSWERVAAATTNGNGRAVLPFRARRSGAYRAVVLADALRPAAASSRQRQSVAARVTRKVRGGSSAFVVTGRVRPASVGRPVRLQQRVEGRWRTVATARVRKGSRYVIRHRATGLRARWRVVKPRETSLRRGVSKPFRR